MTAYEKDGVVYRKNMMALQLTSGNVVADLWVFDYFVVVQFTNKLIAFYEKPLIMGGSMPAYRLASNVTLFPYLNISSPLVDPTVKTWDISISPDNDTSVFYFGLGDKGLQRFHFQVDLDNNTVTLIDYKQAGVSVSSSNNTL